MRRYASGVDFGGGPNGRFAADGCEARARRQTAVDAIARCTERLVPAIRARLWSPDSRLVNDVYAAAWNDLAGSSHIGTGADRPANR